MEYRKAIIHQCVCGQEEDTEVLLPCLEPAEEPEAVGLWGQRHLRYIRITNQSGTKACRQAAG